MKCRRFSLKIHTALNRPVGTKWNHFPFPRDPRLAYVHVFVMVSIFSFLIFIYIYFPSIFAFREFFDMIGGWRMIYIFYYDGRGWFHLVIYTVRGIVLYMIKLLSLYIFIRIVSHLYIYSFLLFHIFPWIFIYLLIYYILFLCYFLYII